MASVHCIPQPEQAHEALSRLIWCRQYGAYFGSTSVQIVGSPFPLYPQAHYNVLCKSL